MKTPGIRIKKVSSYMFRRVARGGQWGQLPAPEFRNVTSKKLSL